MGDAKPSAHTALERVGVGCPGGGRRARTSDARVWRYAVGEAGRGACPPTESGVGRRREACDDARSRPGEGVSRADRWRWTYAPGRCVGGRSEAASGLRGAVFARRPHLIPSFPTWLVGILAEPDTSPKRLTAWWTPLSRNARKCRWGRGQGLVQDPGVSASADTPEGRSEDATSARLTPSRISRTLARSAIHRGSSDWAGPV